MECPYAYAVGSRSSHHIYFIGVYVYMLESQFCSRCILSVFEHACDCFFGWFDKVAVDGECWFDESYGAFIDAVDGE